MRSVQQPDGSPSALDRALAAIRGLDDDAVAAARQRQDQLTKPRGSLGRLEDVSAHLAGLAGVCPPPVPAPAAVAIFAADHGVHAQGVTPWPQEVTGQMVANFLAGGAVACVLAGQVDARVCVVGRLRSGCCGRWPPSTVPAWWTGTPDRPAPGLRRRRPAAVLPLMLTGCTHGSGCIAKNRYIRGA